MGEKVYKPIVKDGDHLIRSKDNPDRVRGLTRDENNHNPDIIKWEMTCGVMITIRTLMKNSAFN